jgi:integrase
VEPVDNEGKKSPEHNHVIGGKKGHVNAEEINDAIKREMATIKKIVSELQDQEKIPTALMVRDLYDKKQEAKKKATQELESGITAGKMDVMSMAWEWWKIGKGPKKTWKRSSKQSIKESIEAFESYIKTIKGTRKLLKSDLSMDLFQNYETYLFKQGLVKNAVGKRLKQIRQFILTIDDLPFNASKIKIYQIEKTPIALTESELTKIENVVLTDDLMNKCRDLFLLGCYTSLRISDLKKLSAQHFHEKEIRILQEKNEKNFRFPITPQIKRILEKYQYKLPKVSEGDINKQIKEVGRLAGIDQPVELTKEFRDRTVRYTMKKYEIIGTHMAVKTFITLGLTWGISIPDIAAIVGKHIRTIQGHYAAGDKEGATGQLRDLWEKRTMLKVV